MQKANPLIKEFPQLEDYRQNRAIGNISGILSLPQDRMPTLKANDFLYPVSVLFPLREYLRLSQVNLEEKNSFRAWVRFDPACKKTKITLFGIDKYTADNNLFAVRGIVNVYQKKGLVKVRRNVEVKDPTQKLFTVSVNNCPASLDKTFTEIYGQLTNKGLEYFDSYLFYALDRHKNKLPLEKPKLKSKTS